ncbi:polysaccharide biosynthesis tyrosine autokinase [Mucilaginibacter sp.]|uniref:GumC family protein n=1 Tax=Mucilaginibacter sp. TaxID=1882438 RepID=UPI003267F22A
MEETEHNSQKKLPNQEIDYFKIGKILISRWYWVAGSLLVCMLWSYIYLWYTPKIYSTGGYMKLEEKKSEIADISNILNSSDRGPSKVQAEISVLQSHTVILNAVKDLNYPISFYVEGRIRTSELYPQKPLSIEKLQFDTVNFYRDVISFKPVNSNSFNLTYKIGGKDVSKNYAYNAAVSIGPTAFVIRPSGDINKKAVFLFKFNAPEDLVGRVRGGLRAGETVKNSNVLGLQITDANPQFAADVLNAVMTEYLIYDRSRKTQSATQMINFIDDQLKYLSTEVKGSEKSIQNFKQKNKLMDVSAAAEVALSKAKDIETQQSILKLQLIAIEDVKQKIIKEKNNVNLNFDAGGGQIDAGLTALITKLDGYLTQRTELSKTFTYNSQTIQDINKSILEIKNTAISILNANSSNIQRTLNYLAGQITQVNQQIAVMPVAERDLISLKRDFEINEKVYSFLSEKKLEAQITRSGILPGATIIEQAQPNYSPVAPNEHDIHRTAIIFGVIIGLGFIILIRTLNPFIYDKETIESLTSVPIIGVIRKFPDAIDEDNTQVLAISKPKSIFAESVRSVRTNLNFIASEKQSKIICITSEVAGEGKSFVAVNLSSTLSLIDKKVILIAGDLRRSKLHKTFKVPNDNGLSNYLAHQTSLDDIILHSGQENLDFIISGPVPPNPSELLHTERMKELINTLKLKYDIIMIDTAPIGLVSDAIPLIRMSDINIFVIRSGKSKYYSATIPQRIAQEYHLDNTVIVLNAFAEDLLHSRYYTTRFTGDYSNRYYYYSDYSGGYEASGYYIDDEKNKWWNLKRWLK